MGKLFACETELWEPRGGQVRSANFFLLGIKFSDKNLQFHLNVQKTSKYVYKITQKFQKLSNKLPKMFCVISEHVH